MNTLARLTFQLMNRLTYRGKFVMICSVFAIPLSLFAVQLALNFHQELNQAQHTRSGISYLQRSTKLIEELEVLRDVSVVVSWRSNSFLVPQVETAKKDAYASVLALIETQPSGINNTYLLNLKDTIENGSFIRGNEAERIDGVYDVANDLIRQSYSWRKQLAYRFVSSSQRDRDTLALLSLLSESEAYTYTLGLVRVYGSLYLDQSFVESHGAGAMEVTYQQLSKQIEDVAVKEEEYAELLEHTPSIQLLKIREAMSEAQEAMYQRLIESLSPEGDPKEYYEYISSLYEHIYQFNNHILSVAEQHLSEAYEDSVRKLSLFYLSVTFFSLLLFYMALGIYKSVSFAIQELSESAQRVAKGDYEKTIHIQTHDELRSVANAMEHMRLSIKEREEKLEMMSQTDGLTKLYNRPFFDKAMEVALANSRRNDTPLSLVMIDIDHFKRINDTYGHQAGDECLKLLSNLMKEQYQRQTDVVARYGGEEFIAILYGQELEEANRQTEKLRKAIEASDMNYQGQKIHMTASFGLVSISAPDWKDGDQLVSLADAALYRAKENGRNRIEIAEGQNI